MDGGVIREKRVDDRGGKSKSKKPAIFIAGFFPTSFNVSEGQVGRGVLPAVRLAVHHINEDSSVLGDYVLHISWNNTKSTSFLHSYLAL
ncbi:unnamed protein product [Allacma fusca]|uniref:Uncharacterized protein n=1 Tax=Allacma fusca TaxID=39272 RepID=A0A8J2PV23_9HEXA|nr:unnamed protein product [Allacma fusca]